MPRAAATAAVFVAFRGAVFAAVLAGAVLASAAGAQEQDFGILSPADRLLYREIFLVQKDGQWEEAQKRIDRLSDKILMGHVTEQRLMHPTDYRSPYEELRDWLALYADHPDAGRIHRLAKRRQPGGVAAPQKPHKAGKTSFAFEEEDEENKVAAPRVVYGPEVIRGHDRAARKILARVHRNVRREYLTVSENLLRGEGRGLLKDVEFGEGLSRVAEGWLRWGDLERALSLAQEGTALSGAHYPLGHWTAGMSAWQLGNFALAREHFAALATNALTSREYRARGAWWASRAALRDRALEDYAEFLRLAAAEQATFYGALARHALGLEFPEYAAADDAPLPMDVLRRDARLVRAMALLEVGEARRAEEELLRLGEVRDIETAAAILLLAERARLAELSVRAAAELSASDALTAADRDAGVLRPALYPFPAWEPGEGFRVDRAFLYAIMREESRFNPEATSRSGARGVMQLMPATAAFITGERGLRTQSGRRALYDPDLNLEIGQMYLLHLMANEEIGDDVVRILAGYNAGPGNLGRWDRRLAARGIRSEDDIFLYLEMLPALETRRYCLKVLRSLWEYRGRLGQSRPTLDALVSRSVPRYRALDNDVASPLAVSSR